MKVTVKPHFLIP